MVPTLDIYRSANILVKQHGTEAPIHAPMKADAMLEKGDLDGQRVWLRIRTVEGARPDRFRASIGQNSLSQPIAVRFVIGTG